MERLSEKLTGLPFWVYLLMSLAPLAAILVLFSASIDLGFLSCLFVAWLLSLLIMMACMIGYLKAGIRGALLRQDISLSTIRGLRWIDFEYFIGGLFSLRAYAVEHYGLHDRDGGIDLVLHKEGKKILVQCKQFRYEPVGVLEARALYGLMIRQKADEAWLITSGSFSDVVLEEFEGDPRLKLIGPSKIMEEVEKVRQHFSSLPDKARDELLDVTNRIVETSRNQDYVITVPRCPDCKERMVLRQRKDGSGRFWGCSQFATKQCEGILNLGDGEKEYLSPGTSR